MLSKEDKVIIARMVAKEVMRYLEPILANSQPKNSPSLLTVNELSREIGYSPKTIYKWVHEDFIPYVKTRSGGVRFDLNKVLGWLEKRKCKGRAKRRIDI